MKLSKRTLEIFKNFASIRQSLLIREGNILTTKDISAGVYSYAVIEETMPQKCGIFNLQEFLSVLSLVNTDEADINFYKNFIEIIDGRRHYTYHLAADVLVEKMEKDIPCKILELGEPDYRFDLEAVQLQGIIKSAAVMSLDVITIKNGELRVHSSAHESTNDYTLNLDAVGGNSKFEAYLPVDKLNFVKGDYTVEVFDEKNVVLFKNNSVDDLYYWVMYKVKN